MSNMNFCPRCATPLTTRHDGGRDRIACPDLDCGFLHFGDFSIGCSAVVLRHDGDATRALLIQRGQAPFAGTWQVPGGYVEHDEPLSLAVEREVLEEAGVEAKVVDLLAFRHMSGGAVNNIYMIWRLEYVSGQPTADGDETADAGFYSLDEIAAIKGVQNISKWGIHQAMTTAPGAGISPALEGPGAEYPGFQLFSLVDIDAALWR